jgi:mannitol/fructose-specific phosphotransferase system IIA component (Ntr-type)
VAKRALSLRDYITVDLIADDLQASTKEEVIDGLLDLLDRAGLLCDRLAARRAVLARENSMSTGLQYGVAIPHGRTDTVDHLICSMGVHRQGVDFGALDDRPSHIFFLTLSPTNKPAPHVQFMSTVSQVLNASGRERILACQDRREIYQVLIAPPSARRAAPAPAPEPASAAGQFELAKYLDPTVLEPNLSGTTRDEVIDELFGLLDDQGLLDDRAAARQAVLDREREMSTGIGERVAIPHARTEAVQELVCAVGVCREGIDFGSLDGSPVQIIVLALTPPAGSDPYLQFAAAMVSALSARGRSRLLAARTGQEMYDALMADD